MISLDPMLTSKLFLYGFCSLMSVFEQGVICSFLKVIPICIYIFETAALFIKPLHICPYCFSIAKGLATCRLGAKGLATCRLGGVISAQKVLF